MVKLSTLIYRGNIIESRHIAACSIKDIYNKDVLSTNDEDLIVYPRSSIKIFQALPFVASNAHIIFNLTKKNIAMSCSSHAGEPRHIKVLRQWIKKININYKYLKCGVHNPLNENCSNNLLLSGNKPTELHNNCSGKHLGMISGCLAKKMQIKNYIDFSHPYQKSIRRSIEEFMQSKIKNKNIGTDGCNAPQYAFKLVNLSIAMINLIKSKENNNKYTKEINIILKSINEYPFLIGGLNRFDSEIIKVTKGRIFCKGGAEGVLLFTDFQKKIGGAIKIIDGNNRALPPIAMHLFHKLNMLNYNEKGQLNKWLHQKLYNHAKKEIGKIIFSSN